MSPFSHRDPRRGGRLAADWAPDSWRRRPAAQQPEYDDPAALAAAVAELARLPPLVTSWEVELLKGQLAEAAAGQRFLLQGGDCAESFADCTSATIAAKLKILLQMSLVLVHGSKRRVIRVGRFVGQYAKPRSQPAEERDGQVLPAYRGDIVNHPEFSPESRRPDPQLLLRGYERAALTLNFVRALIDGGFADLHHPEYWRLDFARDAPLAAEYQRRVAAIADSLRFMETLAGQRLGELGRIDFFASHEGLHLLYEQAQTRQVPHREGWYDLTTHFPWIGMRTADPGSAHVEFFRGVSNPIAVKVGPAMTPEWLGELIDRLDPHAEPGRLTLIHRFGADQIARCLPPLVEEVRRRGRRLLWTCDPMHGNTETTPEGIKTRRFDRILSELEQAFDLHERLGGHLGGVHFELTGEDVTECVGGACGLAPADLKRAYRSQVDPRLNYEQALEMALLIARRMAGAAR
ncbi:MAG TPA: 3-deoxy-7-phosphoheptulonate synthase class II [Thermoanaerobaculia bacterium]|nr:3-deoxy-7-phosphoheptulonate synthase class II [Acidobacteriota bacterium]HRS36356.1 3-deoxy-7-phosphoheptulonate synthase class II [Thermoanaerobaculia bacterium]